jgi:hypothetical protein
MNDQKMNKGYEWKINKMKYAYYKNMFNFTTDRKMQIETINQNEMKTYPQKEFIRMIIAALFIMVQN